MGDLARPIFWGRDHNGYFFIKTLLFTSALIGQKQCAGSEDAVQARLESLASQWETLVAKSAEKSDKLKEASQQQTYNAGVKDMEFWLGEVILIYYNDRFRYTLVLREQIQI